MIDQSTMLPRFPQLELQKACRLDFVSEQHGVGYTDMLGKQVTSRPRSRLHNRSPTL